MLNHGILHLLVCDNVIVVLEVIHHQVLKFHRTMRENTYTKWVTPRLSNCNNELHIDRFHFVILFYFRNKILIHLDLMPFTYLLISRCDFESSSREFVSSTPLIVARAILSFDMTGEIATHMSFGFSITFILKCDYELYAH